MNRRHLIALLSGTALLPFIPKMVEAASKRYSVDVYPAYLPGWEGVWEHYGGDITQADRIYIGYVELIEDYAKRYQVKGFQQDCYWPAIEVEERKEIGASSTRSEHAEPTVETANRSCPGGRAPDIRGAFTPRLALLPGEKQT